MTQTLARETPRTSGRQQPVNYLTPLANIVETEDGYLLEAEMPGVGKDGLEITVENGELIIVGHRTKQEVSGQPLYRESRENDYRRVFELDPSIDTTKISAKMDQGILRLHLPKAESVKPRRIAVTD
jgi:HSP20 family protein